MKKLDVRFTRAPGDSLPVGTLAQDRGRVYFEYAPAYLAAGCGLSPFRLPFEGGLFEHTDLAFGPLPGLFDDSLPDGWGLLLMDRHFRSLGLNLAEVSPLDRLAQTRPPRWRLGRHFAANRPLLSLLTAVGQGAVVRRRRRQQSRLLRIRRLIPSCPLSRREEGRSAECTSSPAPPVHPRAASPRYRGRRAFQS